MTQKGSVKVVVGLLFQIVSLVAMDSMFYHYWHGTEQKYSFRLSQVYPLADIICFLKYLKQM